MHRARKLPAARLAMGQLAISQLAILAVLIVGTTTLLAREWNDASGLYTLQGDYEGIKDGKVQIRQKDGQLFQVRLNKLSSRDRAYVRGRHELKTYEELAKHLKRVRNKQTTLAIYEGFLDKVDLPKADLQKATEAHRQLRDRKLIEREYRTLITEAFAQFRRRNSKQALTALKRASKLDPQALNADLAAGIYLAIADHNFSKAEHHFRMIIKRGEKTDAWSDKNRRHDLLAAFNNLALTYIRDRKVKAAYALWNELRDAKTDVPDEVFHNIYRVRQLIGSGSYGLSKNASQDFALRYNDLFAELGGSHFRPSATTNWLYIASPSHVQGFRQLLRSYPDKRFGSQSLGLEDVWCLSCHGIGTEDCHNSKCKNGTVRVVRYSEQFKRVGDRIVKVRVATPARERCKTCGGRGQVRCSHCINGKVK